MPQIPSPAHACPSIRMLRRSRCASRASARNPPRLRVAQCQRGNSFGVQTLNVENQIAAHRKARPNRLVVTGRMQHRDIGVGHMVQTVRESAVRVFAATGLIGRNRPSPAPGMSGPQIGNRFTPCSTAAASNASAHSSHMRWSTGNPCTSTTGSPSPSQYTLLCNSIVIVSLRSSPYIAYIYRLRCLHSQAATRFPGAHGRPVSTSTISLSATCRPKRSPDAQSCHIRCSSGL